MTHPFIRSISAIAGIVTIATLAACATTSADEASDKQSYVAGDAPTGSNISKRFNKTMAPSLDVLSPDAVVGNSTAVPTPGSGR